MSVKMLTSEVEATAPENAVEFAFATMLAAVAHENELEGDDEARFDIDGGIEVFDATTGTKLGTWALVFFPEESGILDVEAI
ncbi:MAG: hypothetical protein VW405_00620 [Rhodospirillaceae bacterium]